MDSALIAGGDLKEFFKQEIDDARVDLGMQLQPLTEYYLVNLLVEYSHCAPSKAVPGDEPLALLYKRALDATPAERVQLLRNLGDVALYVSGFFSESIERSMVDLDYYISMGGNAYNSLSNMMASRRHGETFAEVYCKLAGRFAELVDLLMEVADRSRTKSAGKDVDLLRVYDLWARTGSERSRKILLEKGLVPQQGIPVEYNQ